MRASIETRGTVAAGLLMLLAVGCPKMRLPEQNVATRRVVEADVSIELMRVRIYEFGDYFGGTVREAADQILEGSDDPTVQRRARAWRLFAIPVIRDAVYAHEEPIAALVDVWALCFQMIDFFETGPGEGVFGDYQSLAIAAVEGAETRLVDLLRRGGELSEKAAQGRDTIRQWAREHPIDNALFVRDSTVDLTTALAGDSRRTAFDALARMDESIGLLSDRLAVYMRTMPTQARWEAEWVYQDIIADPRISGLLDLGPRLADTLATLDTLTQELPARMDAALELVPAERAVVLAAVDDQRVDTLRVLLEERAAVSEALELARQQSIEALHQERVETLEQVAAMIQSTLEASRAEAIAVADHLFLRLLPVLAAAGLLVTVLTVWAVRTLRPRSA